jgi:vacuolar-type H+-ATPase subunit H
MLYNVLMNDHDELKKKEDETLNEIESIYNDTMTKVKELEQEQKKIISDFLKNKENDKMEQIRKSLLS